MPWVTIVEIFPNTPKINIAQTGGERLEKPEEQQRVFIEFPIFSVLWPKFLTGTYFGKVKFYILKIHIKIVTKLEKE